MDGVLVSLFFFSFVSMKNMELVIWMHGTMCWMNIVICNMYIWMELCLLCIYVCCDGDRYVYVYLCVGYII